MKTRQRLFALLLAAALAFAALPGAHARAGVICFYPAGEGTAQHPWQLVVSAHLVWINADPARLEGYFLLMNDITAPATVMIGRAATPFNGSLDGGGNTITVNIDLPGHDNLGLFRQIGERGRVQNLTVAGRVAGRSHVGALAGVNLGGVSGVRATADVSGYSDVGGLLGRNNLGGDVSDSQAAGNVTGLQNVGGLIGVNSGVVRATFATGGVGGSLSAGGLVGRNNASVLNSYATGNVSGGDSTGGLIGENHGSAMNSFATGAVRGAMAVGGIAGLNNGHLRAGVALNAGITGHADSTRRIWGAGTGEGRSSRAYSGITLNAAPLAAGSGHRRCPQGEPACAQTVPTKDFWLGVLGLPFGDTWRWSVSRSLPLLRNAPGETIEPLEGAGTQPDPWRLITPAHLEWMTDPAHPSRLGGYFLLMNNITAPQNLVIGGDTPFSGSFDGNGNIIELNIHHPGQNYVGMFARIGASGRVQNLTLAGHVRGRHRVGALAGESYGHVEGVNFTGSVRGEGSVGGILGVNQGAVRGSSSTGPIVYGASRVGGLVGFNEGRIENSSATSDVYGHWGVGGLLGRNNFGGEVVDSRATGNVLGHDAAVGGLVGASHGSVRGSYATGNVAGGSDGENGVGGLVGGNWGSVVDGAAFGAQITGPPATTGRIWGAGSGNGQGNRASYAMLVNGAPLPTQINIPAGQHGYADLTPPAHTADRAATAADEPAATRHNITVNGVMTNFAAHNGRAVFTFSYGAITQIISNTRSGGFGNTVLIDLSDFAHVTSVRMPEIALERFANAGIATEVRSARGVIALGE